MPLWRTSSHKSTPTGTPESAPGTPTEQPQTPDGMMQNDPVASASQAAGTEWLSGHLHHLTKEQEERLKEFKEVCAKEGYYKPASAEGEGEGEAKASHDDATMLRFLRARKFEVQPAWGQFKETEDWRKDNAIEKLYENIDVDSYESARRMYPQWTGRRDRRGIPIYVFEIKNLNTTNMASYNKTMTKSSLSPEAEKSSTVPERLLRLFALYENLLRFVMPMCSTLPRPNMDTPIVSSTNIVDINGVGLKQFWNLKGHMQDASVLATAHYPETLDRIFIIGAPSFFPTVWSWIKRWFDPVTTSKIFILTAAEVQPTLSSFMDSSNIPTQYGGELEWKWGDMPNLDDDARQAIGGVSGPASKPDGEGFLKGPMVFHGDKIEVLGKENGESRRRGIPVSVPVSGQKAEQKTEQEQVEKTADGEKDQEKDQIVNGDANATAPSVAA